MRFQTLLDRDGPYRDPAWDAKLAEISPPSENVSWLKLVWVAGDLFRPEDRSQVVERWMIYQMHPARIVPAMIWDDLIGPSPRERGRWDVAEGRYIPDPGCNIDQMQWLLFRETGAFGRPYWVVQGTNGGHKRRWSHLESSLSQMNGGPAQPPLPGDLPYAAPDWRLWRQMYQLDRMRQATDLLAVAKKHPEWLDESELAQMDEIQMTVAHWLGEQVDEATGWAGGESGQAYRLNRAPAAEPV